MLIVPDNKIRLDPAFWTKTSWLQLFYGVWVNMAQLAIGLAFGFPAIQVPQLSSPDSEIIITRSEASWIASVMTLFCPIGCLISGFVMDRYGRRVMLIFCNGPMCIGWLYTGLALNTKHIIIGRAITGIGCGMAMGPPRIYTAEISLPNMRGVTGAFPAIALSIGISLQAGLGTIFAWKALCYMCFIFTLINLLVSKLLPETPYYVLKTDTEEHSRTTLAKFRGSKYDLDAEMDQLMEFKEDNDIRKLNLKETIKALFTSSACLPFTLVNAYILFAQMSGLSCVLMWAIEILTMAQSSFDVYTGNFLLALTRLTVCIAASVLLFSVGRKPLALISAVGVSFVSLAVGFFILYYNDEPSLVPQVCFMAYVAFGSLGYNALPFLFASELYPLQVRGILGGITVSITCFLIFSSTKFFPSLMDTVGVGYTMIIFGLSSLFGALFLYLCLPETRELTLQEIEEYYNSRRPTLVSHRRINLSLQQQSNIHTSQSKTTTKSKTKLTSNKHFPKMGSDGLVSGPSIKRQLQKKASLHKRSLQKKESVLTRVLSSLSIASSPTNESKVQDKKESSPTNESKVQNKKESVISRVLSSLNIQSSPTKESEAQVKKESVVSRVLSSLHIESSPTKESEAQDKNESDAKAKKESDSKAKKEAEDKSKEESDAKAKKESDAKAKKEAEDKFKEESDAKAKKEADAKAKEESDTKAKKESDDKASKVSSVSTATEADNIPENINEPSTSKKSK